MIKKKRKKKKKKKKKDKSTWKRDSSFIIATLQVKAFEAHKRKWRYIISFYSIYLNSAGEILITFWVSYTNHISAILLYLERIFFCSIMYRILSAESVGKFLIQDILKFYF